MQGFRSLFYLIFSVFLVGSWDSAIIWRYFKNRLVNGILAMFSFKSRLLFCFKAGSANLLTLIVWPFRKVMISLEAQAEVAISGGNFPNPNLVFPAPSPSQSS